MPELPEVEIVARNLNELMRPPVDINEWAFFRRDLRYIIPQKELRALRGKKISQIRRRAKYLIFDVADVAIISHLGMTGSWRMEKSGFEKRKHDHLVLKTDHGEFVFNDPRRFGFVEIVSQSELPKRFEKLGAEPLDQGVDFGALTAKLRRLDSPVKTAIMNQSLVVGIGNIYASEILYRARVSPLRKCRRVTLDEWTRIWHETVNVLNAAIARGGSTIDDYRNGYGESGEFQKEFFVYGRAGEKCSGCGGAIKQKVIGGRSSFWCPRCQK